MANSLLAEPTMSVPRKMSWPSWALFGVLLLGSAACLVYASAVPMLTPMMVYDSSPAVPKLSDQDISALCHSVSRYTHRVWVYCSAAVAAWTVFAGFLLWRGSQRNQTQKLDEPRQIS
jgi:hypothetical protein